MKIYQYLCLHMKIICWRFHIKTPFAFEICAREICEKFNSRILRIRNAKFSGCCFYMNTYVLGDFQICIIVPLMISLHCFWTKLKNEKSVWIESTLFIYSFFVFVWFRLFAMHSGCCSMVCLRFQVKGHP